MARSKKVREPVAQSVAALITQDDAILSFKAHAKSYLRSSISLACSAAVVLIVGTNAGKDALSQDQVIVNLKSSVGDTGLGDSQVAKYIGLARSLVNHILSKHKIGGPVQEVLQAFTPEEGVNVLVNYLGTQKVANLEDLTIMFNKYVRKPKGNKVAAAPAPLPPVIPTGIVPSGEQTLTHRRPDLGETISVDGPTLQPAVLSASQFIASALKSGHTVVDLGDALFDVATVSDLDFLRQKMLSRSRELSRVAA